LQKSFEDFKQAVFALTLKTLR